MANLNLVSQALMIDAQLAHLTGYNYKEASLNYLEMKPDFLIDLYIVTREKRVKNLIKLAQFNRCHGI